MPRQLAELKQFGTGIKSSPSDTDIHPESAIYSKNIDPISEAGKLKGIKEHLKVLPLDGNLNFIIIPPWDGSANDGAGNSFPNGTTNAEEELIISINNVTVTEKALFDTSARLTNTNFWTSLETKLETAFDDLIGATLGRAANDLNNTYTDVDHYSSDGTAYSSSDDSVAITGTDLQPYRQIGLEFESTVATVDMYVTWNKYDANGVSSTYTYYVSDPYTSSGELINSSVTWNVVLDDTSYLEMNATEMESFNDEAKNHIAFYSITPNDSTSSTGSATTYRMKVFNDVYGVKTIEDKYTADDGGTDVYYDIPGTPADVSLEKNNAQIYIGTGNTLQAKSKWFGKIKHKQFGNAIDGYRLTDSETLPIDKGRSVFNLDHIDYAYDGEYNTTNYERNWDPRITYGISPGMLKLVLFLSDGTEDSASNTNLGMQKQPTSMLTFSPNMIYGSRWLWDELSVFTGAGDPGAGDAWTPSGSGDTALAAWTHNGAGHTYFWATDKNANKIHVLSSDASGFHPHDPNQYVYDHTVPISLTADFANSSQSPVEGSRPTDIIETYGDQATTGNTIVYVLFTQKSDTAYTFDEEFLYYFNPESDISWNSLTVTLHECTPPTPKLTHYGTWRTGTGGYFNEHFYPNFGKRTHDYWAGTYNVKSNYFYWRYNDKVNEPATGAPEEPGGAASGDTAHEGVKGNEWKHSRMHTQPANTAQIGKNLGWDGAEDYLITPRRRGLIDLNDGHNSIGLIAHVKGKFVTNGGYFGSTQWSNWTPRYKYIWANGHTTEQYDDVCMFNINPNHVGVRHRQIAEGFKRINFYNDGESHTASINQSDNTNGNHSDSYNAACDRGIWMAGFGYNNGYSEYDHYIIKFDSASASTGFDGSNEINQMPDEVAGIASMSRRILDVVNSGTSVAQGAHKFWAVLQGDDGTETVLGSWNMNFPTGTNVNAGEGRGNWTVTTEGWTPMIFKTLGTPAMAVATPNNSEIYKTEATTVTGVDYAMQLSATQGEYFIGRGTWKNAGYTGTSGFIPPATADLNAATPYLSYYEKSELPYGLSFTNGDVVDDPDASANFENGVIYYYKLSLVYDGFQESPLNTFYFKHTTGGGRYDTTVVKIRLSQPPERCSAIVVYRKNSVEEFYRMIGEKSFKGGFGKVDDEYFSVMVDDGNLGATYEAITGMPESLRNTSVNYKLSCSAGGYLVVANCYHKDIVNGQNFIFRSMPGNFSVFQWSKDFCILPNEPTAIAYWAGRIFAFDKANMYKIDLNTLAIEDIHEGVGCFGEQSFVITDYGMYFCDANNMYMHDGTRITPIGNDILKNSKFDDLGTETKAWHNIEHAYDPYVQYDAFNQNVMFQFEDTDGEYGSWNYNIPRKRWDLIDIPKPRASVQGNLGELWLSDSDYIYKLGEGSGRKKFDHYTPSLDFGFATVDKRLKRMKIVFNSDTDITKATYNIKMFADETEVDLTEATIKDEENVRTYRLKGSVVRRAKKVRLEITNSNVEIDSIGISYNTRTIK